MRLTEPEKYPVLPPISFRKPIPLARASETSFDRAFNEKRQREQAQSPRTPSSTKR